MRNILKEWIKKLIRDELLGVGGIEVHKVFSNDMEFYIKNESTYHAHKRIEGILEYLKLEEYGQEGMPLRKKKQV